jgi:hypothetical protein
MANPQKEPNVDDPRIDAWGGGAPTTAGFAVNV